MSHSENIQTETKLEESKGLWGLVFERFKEHKMAIIGLWVVVFFLGLAFGADLIANILGLDPNAQSILNRYGEWTGSNWFGTDEAGRDVFIRLIYGARISLIVAFSSAIASMIIGISIGTIAGYFGGWIDNVLMRVTDALLALPVMPILIILAAVDFSKIPLFSSILGGEDSSIFKMIIIFVVFSWMTQARLVRSAVLSVKETEFVNAAKAVGQSTTMIIIKQLIPNVLAPVIVSVTLNVGRSILFESALSFLGLGIQPPTPTWGNMLNNALEMIYTAPSLVVLPGFFIFMIVVAFNFLGDGLQEALDPKAIKR